MNPMHPVEAEELQAYLDNELAAERRASLEQHLVACVDCRRLLDDLRQVSATLQAWQVEPAPPHLQAPSVQAGEQRGFAFAPERRRVAWRLVAAFGGVAAAVLLLVSISIPNLMRSRMSQQVVLKEEKPSGLVRTPAKPAPPPPASTPARGYSRPAETSLDKQAGGKADLVSELRVGEEYERGRTAKMAAAENASPRQMLAREVSLILSVKDFDVAKQSLLAAVERAGGYVAHSASAETPGQPRRADLVVRIPVTQLSAVLETLRGLGRVTHEQQSGEEVTAQYVDLQARTHNARATEERLVRVLAERTGKVKDILEVEREIARVREEIERMDAQGKHLESRVSLATVQVALVEEFEARLEPTPVGAGTRIRNAFVEGYQNFVAMFVGLVVFLGRQGLNLLFWGGLAWLGWRGIRARVLAPILRSGWDS